MMTLGLLFLIVYTALAAVDTTASATNTLAENVGSDFVLASTNQALKSIKSAEASGADVTALVERFNKAIDLQEEAERGDYESCPSYNECIVQSNTMMLSIVEDSSLLGNQLTAKFEQVSAMTFTVYVPIGSFALSVVIVLTYRAWVARRSRKYQSMDIHQRSAR